MYVGIISIYTDSTQIFRNFQCAIDIRDQAELYTIYCVCYYWIIESSDSSVLVIYLIIICMSSKENFHHFYFYIYIVLILLYFVLYVTNTR